MKIQKGGIILVADDGDEASKFHATRSRSRESGKKSPTKFLGHINSPCRVCNKKVTVENGLTCDKCDSWIHYKSCSSLTKHEYDFLCNTPKTRLKYFCPKCQSTSSETTGKDPVLIQEARMDALTQMCEAVQAQNNTILDLMNKTDKKEEALQGAVKEVFESSKEKDEKKNNLILFNLPESSNTDAKKGQEEDLNRVKEVLKFINDGDVIQDFNETTIERMGTKKDDDKEVRPRAVKIQFATFDKKMKILRNAKNLAKHVTFKTLGISPDKTFKEREAYKTMRKEMVERNAKGEDLIIFRDEIILRKDRPTYNNDRVNLTKENKEKKAGTEDTDPKTAGAETEDGNPAGPPPQI